MKKTFALFALVLFFSFTSSASYAAGEKLSPPIQATSEHPGEIHIINNESFRVQFSFTSPTKESCEGFLNPGQETKLKLTHFTQGGNLVVLKQAKLNNEEKWVPETPYRWTISRRTFAKGGQLFIKDAYMPIDD